MADGTVGVRQAPDADRLIDNEALTVGGQTVYRQRVVVAGDYRVLLDYDIRTDGNPVYVGKNRQASLVADTDWIIQRLSYDASARLVDTQVLTGAWTNRSGLAWKTTGGD